MSINLEIMNFLALKFFSLNFIFFYCFSFRLSPKNKKNYTFLIGFSFVHYNAANLSIYLSTNECVLHPSLFITILISLYLSQYFSQIESISLYLQPLRAGGM